MIAKSSWFSPRKYGGWGLTPNCWQGWVYLAVIAIPMILISNLRLPGFWSTGLMLAWALVFTLDFIDIMLHLKRDERDILHEALAERNAMWFMVSALAIGFAYQAAASTINKTYQVDPVIIIALIGAVIVKAISNFYLRNK